MKTKIIFMIVLLLMSSMINAQTVGVTNGSSFTPQSLLHVYTTAAAGSGNIFQIGNVTTGNASTDGFGIGIDANMRIMFKNLETSTTSGFSFYANNIERMRIGFATGGTSVVWVNLVSPYGDADVFSARSNVDGDYAVNGYNTLATATTGGGIYGETYAPNTNGVWGVNTNTNFGTGVAGAGNGQLTQTMKCGQGGAFTGDSLGSFSYATRTDGTGILGVGNGCTSIYTITGGSGAAFNGTRYGMYSTITNETTAGTGYTYGATYSSIIALSQANVATTNLYHFTIHGTFNDYGSGYARRSGAVLGYNNISARWGCLAYTNSSSTGYGGYGTTGWTNGAGKTTQGANGSYSGIGCGWYGGLIGGWIRGDVYGLVAKGNRYSLYVDGKTYTNDVVAVLSPSNSSTLTKNDQKKLVSYMTTSTTVDVYSKGSSTLINGTTTIKFDDTFRGLISTKVPVIITITPTGDCKGIYVVETNKDGFSVKELQGGTSNVGFSWIAIGTKSGCETPENPEEILQISYDNNMNGVMFNENDTINSATPVYWDAKEKKLKFEELSIKNSNTTKIALTKQQMVTIQNKKKQ